MKTYLLLSFSSLILFSGCVTANLEDLQTRETYKSKIIKSVSMDENITTAGAGTTSLLNTNRKKSSEISPLLAPPKISKITINGYIDTDGDYHEKEIIHLKVEDAKFVENKKYFSINTQEQ